MKALINELRQFTLSDLMSYIIYSFLGVLLAVFVSKWFIALVVIQVIRLVFDVLGRSNERVLNKLNGNY